MRKFPAGRDANFMHRPVLFFQSSFAVTRTMVRKALNLIKMLVQRTAKSDIQFLKAAANAQNGCRRGFSRADQWNSGGVAGLVQ